MTFLIWQLIRIPFDGLFGVKHRSYNFSTAVAAPKSVTWLVASAHQCTLEGTPPITIDAQPDPDRPGVYTGVVSFSGRHFALAYRIVEERPGEALLLEVLKNESAPECCPGENYVCAVGITGDDTASHLEVTQNITHTRFGSRFLVPFAVPQNCRRLARNAELRAGTQPPSTASKIEIAALTGALTFASFYAPFGFSAAAILVALLLLHELGHVAAFMWLGLPVKGIYFVPFFGAAAVSAERYRNEAERGLTALMGPGLSIASTAIFLAMAQETQSPLCIELALVSAFLNGFNLLPVLPLDGGHIAQSLLSRFSASTARAFHIAALLIAAALALYFEFYLLAGLILLVAPVLRSRTTFERWKLPALTPVEAVWLSAGYAAAIAFYVCVIVSLGS